MRRTSVAALLRLRQRAELGALSAGERIALALRLGDQSLDLFCAKRGIDRESALRIRRGLLQRRRRPSACLESLGS